MKTKSHIYMANLLLEELTGEEGKGVLSFPERSGLSKGSYRVPYIAYIAMKRYPSYFRAGSAGPDFFPDILIGQGIMHTKNSGKYLEMMFDHLATYSPRDEEFYKGLSFFLGYMMHYSADLFSHYYVNKYVGAPFPDLSETLGFFFSSDPSEKEKAIDNIKIMIRHIAIETYMDSFVPKNERMGMEIPVAFLRTCFGTTDAVKKVSEIYKIAEKRDFQYNILATLVTDSMGNPAESSSGTHSHNLTNDSYREKLVESYLRISHSIAVETVKHGFIQTLDDNLVELLKYAAVLSKSDFIKVFGPVFLDVYDVLNDCSVVIDILNPLGFVKRKLVKAIVRRILFGYMRDIAVLVSDKEASEIKNYDDAKKIIKDAFLDVENLLRSPILFEERDLPEKLKKEWGNYGRNRNTNQQDFSEFDRCLQMGKLCLMGTDNLNDAVEQIVPGYRPFQSRKIQLTVHEIEVGIKTSNKSDSDTNADVNFHVVTKDGCEILKTLDKKWYNDFELGDYDRYRILLP